MIKLDYNSARDERTIERQVNEHGLTLERAGARVERLRDAINLLYDYDIITEQEMENACWRLNVIVQMMLGEQLVEMMGEGYE